MKAVRLDDGAVCEIFQSDKAGLAGRFTAELILSLVDAPDTVQIGWALIDGEWKHKPAIVTEDDVNAERDRRMNRFSFGGKEFQLGGPSLANVQGVGTLALAAIFSGSEAGNFRWADANEDFSWIAADNSSILMDAQTAWAFAQAAASWRKQCIYRARALKDMASIPADYTHDSHWL